MRADINVSVRKPGAPLGTRCEIKNVNSIRFIGQAIEHEARRQIEILEDGGTIHQETRLFDAKTGETRSMRSKEEAHDYRYFPDPDLLPLELTQDYVDRLAKDLPELPDHEAGAVHRGLRAVALRCRRAGGRDARPRIISRRWRRGRDAKQAANWVINELFGRLNKEGKAIAESPVSADQLGAIVDLIKDGTISGKIAKDVFDIVFAEGGDPRAIVEDARPDPGHRYGRHRDGDRSDHRRQSRQSAAGQGEAHDARLVRRPGDEGDGRQSEPASGQ